LDLADGNSPAQVAEILYRDELAKGAHLADIGIWKNLFDRSVADDIGRLVSQGYLSVRGDEEPKKSEKTARIFPICWGDSPTQE